MTKFNIEIDKSKCIGCGACASVCDNMELKDGKAYPKQKEVEEIGCNKEAENVCPVHAIRIAKIE